MKKSYLLLLPLALMAGACSDDNNGPDIPVNKPLEVTMLKQWEAYYFRPNYNHDPNKPTYSNYFVELAQTEVGMDGFLSFPMVEGEYILDLDLNVLGLSDSPDHPYIPAGTYKATNSVATDADVDYTFNLANTVLIRNIGAGETEGSFMFHYYRFTDGEIKVERDGDDYSIDATFMCTKESSDDADAAEPQIIHVTFAGTIDVTNPSPGDDTPYNYDRPIDLTPAMATSTLYEENDCDNYMLRFFSSTNITSDAIHINEPGMKLQFSLNAPKGSGIAGEYTITDEGSRPGTANAGKRWGSAAEGSYAEVVNDNMTIQYSLLKSGKITIADRGDGTYTATADCVDSNGYQVKLSFNGKFLTDKLIVTTSTLKGDVVFNAKQCTDIMTFGNIIGNGTTDVWVTLADETRVLMLDLVLPGTGLTTIPEGRYLVRANSYDAFTAFPGSVEISNGQTYINPTAYIEYNEDGTVRNYAPIIGGTIDIKRNGDSYTFTYELYDDYSPDFVTPSYNKISGSVTTALPAFHGQQDGSIRARKGRRIR